MKRKREPLLIEGGELLNLLASRIPAATLRNVLFNKRYFSAGDLEVLRQVSKTWRSIIEPQGNAFEEIAGSACAGGYMNQLLWILPKKVHLFARGISLLDPFETSYGGSFASTHDVMSMIAVWHEQEEIVRYLAKLIPLPNGFSLNVLFRAIERKSLKMFELCWNKKEHLPKMSDILLKIVDENAPEFCAFLLKSTQKAGKRAAVFVTTILCAAQLGKYHFLLQFMQQVREVHDEKNLFWNDYVDTICSKLSNHPALQAEFQALKK